MNFSIVNTETSFYGLEKEWQDMCTRSTHYYFQTFQWMVNWWVYFGQKRDSKLHIVVAREGDTIVFIWPLIIERKRSWKILRWMGADINDYCDVLIDDSVESPLEYVTAAWNVLKSTEKVDLVEFDKVRADSVMVPFLQQHKFFCTGKNTAPYIRLNRWENWEDYFNHFKKNLRVKTHARHVRALQKKGNVSFITNDTKQIKKIIDIVIQQKIDRFVEKGQSGILEDEVFPEYLLAVANMAKTQNTIHLAVLYLDETIIACHLGFLYQGRLYWYIPSFNQEYSKYSPGRILLEEIIQWCFQNNIAMFDFLLGDERYKYQWTDEDITICSFSTSLSLKGLLYCKWNSGKLKPFMKKVFNSLPGGLKRKIYFYLK